MSRPDLGPRLAALLPDDAPPEMAAAVALGTGSLDPALLARLMTDAESARALLDAGDVEGARSLVEPYRQMAAASGLGELYEHFVGSLISGTPE